MTNLGDESILELSVLGERPAGPQRMSGFVMPMNGVEFPHIHSVLVMQWKEILHQKCGTMSQLNTHNHLLIEQLLYTGYLVRQCVSYVFPHDGTICF